MKLGVSGSRRLGVLAFAAAATIAGPARAADNPLLGAWTQCLSDEIMKACPENVPVEAHRKAVEATCGPARRAYADSRAAVITAAKHRSPERAALKANRQVAAIDRQFDRLYRNCLGEPE